VLLSPATNISYLVDNTNGSTCYSFLARYDRKFSTSIYLYQIGTRLIGHMKGLAGPSSYLQSPAVAAILLSSQQLSAFLRSSQQLPAFLRSSQQLPAFLRSSQQLPTVTYSFPPFSAVSRHPLQFPAILCSFPPSSAVSCSPRQFPATPGSSQQSAGSPSHSRTLRGPIVLYKPAILRFPG